MELNSLWFILIAVLYAGYFVLEGFDFGVGMLLPFLGKTDRQRRAIINTIGPHWDGNEVWLITAGGATFAAFPHWYATLFSGFYLPLFLMLMALILRGVAFEFRSKDENPLWRGFWDWTIFIGSLIPAFLWGVAFTNIVRGVPIDSAMIYTGGFWNLLNPFALLGGLVTLTVFLVHGAMFLSLKTTGEIQARARTVAKRMWIPAVVAMIGFLEMSNAETDLLTKSGMMSVISPIIVLSALLAAGWFVRTQKDGWAFLSTAITVIAFMATIFLGLYPRVMVSSLNPEWSLTIYNAASGPVTLRTMTTIAAIFIPIVLAYQAWSYWVFRKRISEKSENLEY